jgi:23S rRNA pseudouridine1911/1915/1917 synthase
MTDRENTLINEHDDSLHDDSLKDELYEHHRFKADKGQTPVRIDKFLTDRIEKVSRSRLQAALKAGNILVNGKAVKPNYKVKPLDEIVIVLATPPCEIKLNPENIPLQIIYEDNELLVVNKPPGLVVHPGSGNYTGTLVNGLLYHFQHLPTKEAIRPGLVHRIDKNTSGLLVVAKTEFSMNHLARQFFEHTIERKYIALVWGDLKNDSGTITGNIDRHERYRQMFTVFPDGDKGKPAITHYKVLERFGYVTLIECELETGRTHQIRVHMKYIGHPIFNDDTYGGNQIVKGTIYSKYKRFVENCFALCPRQALHARMLGFQHPSTGKHLRFDCDLPQDMMQLINKWCDYFNAIKIRYQQ